MKQLVSTAIILSRIDYGEADRILTLLTPEYGKLHLLARGVRRIKSKLAGGIELFSVSTITYIQGKSELGTLISTRLIKHYGTIVADLDRTMLGYELIKRLNKITEDQAEAEYFTLLEQAFEALDDPAVSLDLIRLWFDSQLIRLGGHGPNLQTDATGQKLDAAKRYVFDFDAVCFTPAPGQGKFDANHIKFLRLSFGGHPPKTLKQVQGSAELCEQALPLVTHLFRTYVER